MALTRVTRDSLVQPVEMRVHTNLRSPAGKLRVKLKASALRRYSCLELDECVPEAAESSERTLSVVVVRVYSILCRANYRKPQHTG